MKMLNLHNECDGFHPKYVIKKVNLSLRLTKYYVITSNAMLN